MADTKQPFLDLNGSLYFWGKVKALVASAISGKVDKAEGKQLSTNDYTDADKAKLDTVEQGANAYTLPDATAAVKGGVLVGDNISVANGKISVRAASTSAKGVVQLSSATNSSGEDTAATSAAVKAAYDLAAAKQAPATTLAGYGIKDAYSKTEVDAKLTSAMHYKGTKDSYADLPATGNSVGDMWNITAADTAHGINAGDNVAWNGTGWDVQAGTVDLSAYLRSADLVAITNAELDDICK